MSLVTYTVDSPIPFIHNLPRKSVAEAFWNSQIEEQLHESQMIDCRFFTPECREKCMEELEERRRKTLYTHVYCDDECKRRGIYPSFSQYKFDFPSD